MSLYKTEAIVIRKIRYGEADKILTLLSPKGQIQAIAKGSRRIKSRLGGRIEPFSLVNLVLYEGKNLHTITQASLIKPYKNIQKDYSKYVIAIAALELVGRVTFSGQDEKQLFELLKSTLDYLDSPKRAGELLLLNFDWQVLKILGFEPHLDKSKEGYWFNLEEGYFQEEASSEGAIVKLKPLTKELLESIINLSFTQLDKLEPDTKTLKQLSFLTKQYMDIKIQTKLKSRNYVE